MVRLVAKTHYVCAYMVVKSHYVCVYMTAKSTMMMTTTRTMSTTRIMSTMSTIARLLCSCHEQIKVSAVKREFGRIRAFNQVIIIR